MTPIPATVDAELELAELRFRATRAGFDATGQFANHLAVELDDEQAQVMLAGVMRALDAVRAALDRRDAARAHRLLDLLDRRLVELTAYCLKRQAELYPAEAEQLERDDDVRLEQLARRDAAAAVVVREQHRRFAVARARFAPHAGRHVDRGRDLVRTLVGQVQRTRAPRAHAPPGRDAPASTGSPERPPRDDDDPDLAAPAGAAA